MGGSSGDSKKNGFMITCQNSQWLLSPSLSLEPENEAGLRQATIQICFNAPNLKGVNEKQKFHWINDILHFQEKDVWDKTDHY